MTDQSMDLFLQLSAALIRERLFAADKQGASPLSASKDVRSWEVMAAERAKKRQRPAEEP